MVVGIAPPDYIVVPPAEMIWIPLVLPPERWNDHGDHELGVAGLVRQGVSTEQAVRELSMIDTRLAKEYPNKGFDGTVRGQSPAEQLVGQPAAQSLHAARRRCARAAHRMRQRREPVAGPRHRASRRDRDSRRARRVAATNRRTAVDRKFLLGIGGGILGLGVAAAGVKFLVTQPSGNSAVAGHHAQHAGVAVHVRIVGRVRARVRTVAGVARVAARSATDAARRRPRVGGERSRSGARRARRQ